MTGAHAAETVNDGDFSMATYKETVVCEARCCACPEGGFVRTPSLWAYEYYQAFPFISTESDKRWGGNEAIQILHTEQTSG